MVEMVSYATLFSILFHVVSLIINLDAISIEKRKQLAVVFPRSQNMDLNWTRRNEFSHIDFVSYPYYGPYEQNHICLLPMNKGEEAMTYLTYIIQFYESLPEKVFFVHGHYNGWHQLINIDDILSSLYWENVTTFTNLRSCSFYPETKIRFWTDKIVRGKGDQSLFNAMFLFWQEFGMARFGFPQMTNDTVIESYCCSQFLVDKDSIRRLPVGFYLELRSFLMNSKWHKWSLGRVFEYIWHIIFTGRFGHVTTEQTCRRVFDLDRLKLLTPDVSPVLVKNTKGSNKFSIENLKHMISHLFSLFFYGSRKEYTMSTPAGKDSDRLGIHLRSSNTSREKIYEVVGVRDVELFMFLVGCCCCWFLVFSLAAYFTFYRSS